MKRLFLSLLLMGMMGCTGALKGGTVTIPTPVFKYAVACVVKDPASTPVVGAMCVTEGQSVATNGDGYGLFPQPVAEGSRNMVVTKDGYAPGSQPYTLNVDTNVNVTLISLFPSAPSRDVVLGSHESFQGAVLHTTQFGDLNWWPTAFTSLNATDKVSYYAQARAWGDTDVTVSVAWDYGEPGQPYGTGQLVPPTDLTGSWPLFRSYVKDVIQHGFTPRIFMSGDNGFNYYMWVMPLTIAALRPQANDSVDLVPYVKLQMCYDSCVPGWQPKEQVGEAILATRTACGACVIALEFSSGYSSQGDGGAFWLTDAGMALDELDWEGNRWPVTNWDQYWQILARWLGPLYVRPPSQPASDDPTPPFYLGQGTPRGPYGVQCFEPMTYDWVRGNVPVNQVPLVYSALKSLGCQVIDMPVQ